VGEVTREGKGEVMDRWPHQIAALQQVIDASNDNVRRILLCCPTGGGKTQIALDIADEFTSRRIGVILYTNRRLLVDQSSRVLQAAGVEHGIRAAGHDTDAKQLFQIASIQTEHSRVTKTGQREIHDARLVLLDEAHLQTGQTVQAILQKHLDAGAHIVGLTATPIGLAEYYDRLIVAGTTSELRACGALVPCRIFGPDEPDLAAWKKQGALKGWQEGQDLTERQASKVMMTTGIFGRVWEWFDKLNPERKPTILFASGVKESLWFAEQFSKAGVSAAHIDGSDVWVNGKLYRTSQEAREDVLNGSRDGTIGLLCNRFVLREGIDAPWLAHGIFATIFGSLQSYLQSGGRLLRSSPGLCSVTIQDHGGNWHRHGSLNADRTWLLEYTDVMIHGLRADRLRAKKEREPYRCPQCGTILAVRVCPCGYEAIGKRSRPVVQTNGTLKEMQGDICRPRSISQKANGPALWERMYFRSCSVKGRKTFRQAEALFAQENNWCWPDRSWPYMPLDPMAFFRFVGDVPPEELIPKG
jgi:superfamily II DNA or RNA helicase